MSLASSAVPHSDKIRTGLIAARKITRRSLEGLINTAVSSDEKIMATLAHGSVLLMFLGPIVPVILWATQRKKSKFVSFHALQAMGEVEQFLTD